MAYENTGTISKNKKKEKPNHPDITGRVTITEPGEYWISGWQRNGSSGPFYSLSFKKKDQQGQSSAAAPSTSSLDDDEIPF